MIKIDKKCVVCPVRKFAIQAAYILRNIYDLNEQILDVLEQFDTGYTQLQNIKQECKDIVKK